MKYAKLKGRIIERFGSLSNFAKAIGKTKQWLYSRFKNKKGMSIKEVILFCDMLEIPYCDIPLYFFDF